MSACEGAFACEHCGVVTNVRDAHEVPLGVGGSAPLVTREASRKLRVIDGPRAFFGGIGFVVSRPSVWPYAVVPVFVLSTLTVGLGALGLWGSWHLVSAIVSGASAWAEAGRWVLEILIGSVVLVTAALSGFAFAQPLSGFALEAISERQGVALGHAPHPKPAFFANMKRSIAVNLLGLAVGVPLFVVLTIIEIAAPPAAVVTWPLKLVLSALLLAWDLLDYPLGLRGVSVGARLSFFGRNFWALLAFGCLGAVVLLVPGLGLLLLPFGVAGATRLVVWTDA
jgi:CysZ protein